MPLDQQIDLFSYTPTQPIGTPTSLADHTVTTPDHTDPKVKDAPVGFRLPPTDKPEEDTLHEGEGCLLHFVLKEAIRMWPAAEHRKRSIAQLKRFLRFEGNDLVPILEFTEDHCHEFLDHIAQSHEVVHKGTTWVVKGASEATQNRYAATLSKVFRTAKHRLEIHFHAENAMARPRFFAPEEIADIRKFFIDRGDQWMADMVEVGCVTGMRRMEIYKVALGIIPISSCGKHAIIEAENSKNGFARATPISQCLDAINRLKESLPKMFSHRSFYRRWALCKQELAPNDPHFVFHCTRHTAATLMTNMVELPTVQVQKWLGHRSERTTAKYVSQIDSAMEGASARLADVLAIK